LYSSSVKPSLLLGKKSLAEFSVLELKEEYLENETGEISEFQELNVNTILEKTNIEIAHMVTNFTLLGVFIIPLMNFLIKYFWD